MKTCSTCKYFAPLKPGHAAICMEKWRHVPWNATVPLTTAGECCEEHQERDQALNELRQSAAAARDAAKHAGVAIHPRVKAIKDRTNRPTG